MLSSEIYRLFIANGALQQVDCRSLDATSGQALVLRHADP